MTITNPLSDPTIFCFLVNFASAILAVVIPAIAVSFVIVGFLFVSAVGNEQKLTSAKKFLKWVLIASAIALGIWVIIIAVENLLSAVLSVNLPDPSVCR